MQYFLLLFCLIFLTSSFSQWIPQNLNSPRRLLSIYFLSEYFGWAGGNDGSILKTTNGVVDRTYISIGTRYTVQQSHLSIQ